MIRRSRSRRVHLVCGALGALATTLLLATAATAAPPTLVLESFTAATSVPGATLAGGHPDLEFAYTLTRDPAHPEFASGEAKDTVVDLPVGLVGNPGAASACPELLVELGPPACPPDSQIGLVTVDLTSPGKPDELIPAPLYNVVPSAGHPDESAFTVAGVTTPIGYANVQASNHYGLRLTVSGIASQNDVLGPLVGVSVHLWGVPAASTHDPERVSAWGPFELKGHSLQPFLTNPVACDDPKPEVKVAMDSWQQPGRLSAEGAPDLSDPNWKTAAASVPAVTGCDALAFNPSIEVQPTVTTAGEPTGLETHIHIPQNEEPNGRATERLKDASVTLPLGMHISPSAANGLVACQDAQLALESDAAPSCPKASKVGEVRIETPLLSHPLSGGVFVGQPLPGNPYRMFVVAQGSGVVVKLAGSVAADPVTGQLTATFQENPQLPFTDMTLKLDGGPQAVLANSSQCETMAASAQLTSFADATLSLTSPPFTTSMDGNGAACPSPRPFAPAFTAGTTNPQAGGFSPFTLTLSRGDVEQDLSGISVQTPPGLEGMLSSVPLCGEPQAQLGTCPASSLIGHTTVGAGAGTNPFYLGGSVFLTGPYKGAPFGLSIVVPAIAGPFNLGTEVVRSTINVDPHTAQVTIKSNPLPTILQGIPLDLRTVNVTVDRPGFMFNPTSCEPLSIGGTITSTQGATANVSSRFQAANCANLPFKPSFSALVRARQSKKNGASLHVVVKSGAGQANIGSVKVNLPKQLPSRLSTLNQACLEATFKANPASCPAGSKVGGATAYTPVLPVALTGPVYFVSHGGAKFPELVVVLQGDGVTVDLAGETFINEKTGITSSTFRSVPDVPITRFDLVLPTGAHSAFAGNGNFCKGAMYMPTQIKGQNGAVVKRKTRIAVSGCPKTKKTKKK